MPRNRDEGRPAPVRGESLSGLLREQAAVLQQLANAHDAGVRWVNREVFQKLLERWQKIVERLGEIVESH